MASSSQLFRPFIRLCCLIGLLTIIPCTARGDGVSSARLSLDSAEQRLANTTFDLNDAQRRMNWAVADEQGAFAQVNNAQSAYDALRSILDDPNIVQQAIDDVAHAARLADEKAVARDVSQKRLAEINAANDQIRTEARRVYETSPAFTDTGKALETATSQLDAATAAAEAGLQLDPQFIALRAESDRLNREAQPLRDQRDADPQQLAAASQRWIDAAGRAGTYRQNWINADRAVVNARQALTDAQRARAALDARFQNDLATDPNLIVVNNDRVKEEENLAALTEDATRLEQARVAAERRAGDLRARLLDAQHSINAVDLELAAAQNDANATGFAVQDAARRLRSAIEAQNQAISQRDAAVRDLRLAIDDARREQLSRDQLARDHKRALSDRDAAQGPGDNNQGGVPVPVAQPPRVSPPVRPPRDRTPNAELDQQMRVAAEKQAADARQTAEQRSQEVRDREQAAAAQKDGQSQSQQTELNVAAKRIAQQAADREAEMRRQADAAEKERQQSQKSRDEAQQRAADAQQKVNERAAADQQRQQQQESQRIADSRARDEAQAKADADRNQQAADAKQREMEAQTRQQQQKPQTDSSSRSPR